ncbi:hypothetical protein OROMI_021088 [Orobanche minor]
MQFLVRYLKNLSLHTNWDLKLVTAAYVDAYESTLKKWHGRLAKSIYTIADKILQTERTLFYIRLIGRFETFNAALSLLFGEIETIFSEANVNISMVKAC